MRESGEELPADLLRIVSEGHSVPFSKGLLGQSLTATGLSPERAYRVARAVEHEFEQKGVLEVSPQQLRVVVSRELAATEGSLFLERYFKWNRLVEQDRPVIILIGGATGVGKTTVANLLANRLGIMRVISTDTIREVMRTFFSPVLMPAIHYSSFDADQAVRQPVSKEVDRHVLGFVEQVERVNAGVEGVVRRAATEGMSVILEGVHLVPGFTPPLEAWDNAIVLPMMIMVGSRNLHRSFFLVRDRETGGRRPIERALQHFDAIRKIQEFILTRADEEGTLVIENFNIDNTMGIVVDTLYDLIEKHEESDRQAAKRAKSA